MNENSLMGRTAVVTGGTRGIGFAIAQLVFVVWLLSVSIAMLIRSATRAAVSTAAH